MNSKHSIGLFFNRADSAVALAAMRGIANRSLGQCIGQAQRIIRERDRDDTTSDEPEIPTLDERNEQDLSAENNEPPVGLEAQPTAEELLAFYARIHVAAMDRVNALATTQWDYPQDLKGRLDFMLQRARESLTTRPARFATEGEKIAFVAKVSQAQKDYDFWRENQSEVHALVKDALASVDTDGDDALDVVDGVEAHQYAVQAGIGIAQTMARLQSNLARFKQGTLLGRQMASEYGALESQLPSLVKFVDTLEAAYSTEILAAAKAGRTINTVDAIEIARTDSIDRMVEKALRTQREFRDFAEETK